jgi:hypothetical protein
VSQSSWKAHRLFLVDGSTTVRISPQDGVFFLGDVLHPGIAVQTIVVRPFGEIVIG